MMYCQGWIALLLFTGSYDMALVIAGILLLIGATSVLTLTRRPIGAMREVFVA